MGAGRAAETPVSECARNWDWFGGTSADSGRARDARLHATIKLLTQYERLTEKYNARIPPTALTELNRKRDAGTFAVEDLPAMLRREWPGGIFDGQTLAEISALCGRRSSGDTRR